MVDVKATDEKGRNYQIEIQLDIHAALASRILFTWSSIYHSQIQEGDDYGKLNPVISIWILNGNLFLNRDSQDYEIAKIYCNPLAIMVNP